MAVPSPSLKPTPYGVKGIQYHPIASSTLSPPSSGIGHMGVTEKSFSFASTGQSPSYDYLTVNLLEYSNPTQSLGYAVRDRYPPSTVIVRGHIMALPNGDYGSDIDEIDSAYFEHVFLTDWYSSSIWTPISSIYSFEDQNNSPNSSPSPVNTWSPTGTHTGWINGSQAVAGNAWENGLTTKAWNIGIGGTFLNANGTGTPSNTTGPSGGVSADGSTPGGSSSGAQKFLYTEASNPNDEVDIVWLTRTPSINISASMADPANNPARLRFKVHAYGADIGELKVYVDTFGQSTSTQASLLEEYATDNWSQQSGTDPYEEVIIDLPSNITQTDDDFYFYITHQLSNGSFRGDLAIDRVVFEEEVIAPNYTSGFYQEVANGNNGTLIVDGDPFVQFDWDGSSTGDANVTFTLNTSNGAYIKATYLLM